MSQSMVVILLLSLLNMLNMQPTSLENEEDRNITINSEGIAEPPFHKIRKCCPPEHVMDEFYVCVSVDNADQDEKFMAEVSNLTRQHIPAEVYKDVLSITELNCDPHLVSEILPVQLFKNGTLLVFSNLKEGQVMLLDAYHCLELFSLDLMTEELLAKHSDEVYVTHGIHALTCNETLDDENLEIGIDHITKCCQEDLVISTDYTECVEAPDEENMIQMYLPRVVHSHKTNRPTGYYQVQQSSFPDICPCSGIQVEVPDFFLTNGLVVFNSPQED